MDVGAERTDADALQPLIARYGLEGAPAPELPAVPLDDDVFKGVAVEASGRRLIGLLLDAVEDGAFAATEEQADLTAAYAASWYERTQRIDRGVVEAHVLFAARGIEHRVVKGLATASLVYGDSLQRPYVDADVAVRRGRFAEAVAVLLDAGWRRIEPNKRKGFDEHFGQGTALERDGAYLDLHRMLVHPPAGDLLAGDLGFAGPPQLVERDGALLPVLALADGLVHAAAHMTFDPPDTSAELIVARDVAGYASLVGDDDRRRRARAWGIETIVENAVLTARQALGLETDAVLLALPAAEQRLIDVQGRTRGLARLGYLPGWANKARFVVGGLVPSREYLDHFGWTRSGYLLSYVRAARGRW